MSDGTKESPHRRPGMEFVRYLTPSQDEAFRVMCETHRRMLQEANDYQCREMTRILAMPHLHSVPRKTEP